MDPRQLTVVLTLVHGLVALAAAALVLRAGPTRRTNLTLALFLAYAGLFVVEAFRLTPLAHDRAWSYTLALLVRSTNAGATPMYLAFVAQALPVPLLAPLRTRAGLSACYVAAAGLFALPFLAPRAFALGPATETATGLVWAMGPAERWVTLLLIAGFSLALGCTLWAFARAPRGSLQRQRMVLYALAFGAQDVVIVGGNVLAFAGLLGEWSIVVFSTIFLLAHLLLVYALLRHQLLDVDLKIKWTVRRGAVAAAFVGVFLVGAQVAETYLQEQGILVGGIAAGLLLFALRPLERAAGRIADAAMPGVRDTEEYRTVRKREVYRAAVESALEDGEVTEKERGVLATLAAQLGLDPREAYDVEREARAAMAAT